MKSLVVIIIISYLSPFWSWQASGVLQGLDQMGGSSIQPMLGATGYSFSINTQLEYCEPPHSFHNNGRGTV